MSLIVSIRTMMMRSMIIDYSSYRKNGDTLSFRLTKLSLTITVLCFIPESLYHENYQKVNNVHIRYTLPLTNIGAWNT